MNTEKSNTRPTLLVLARHAESERNRAKKHSTYFADEEARQKVRGIPDHKIKITPDGWEHGRRTGVALRQRFGTFDYLYTSGYVRTDETLDAFLEAYTSTELVSMKRRRNPFIRERDPGHTYDMTTKEAETAFPYLAEYWKTFGGYMATPPGGESLAKVAERVYLFLNMLFRDRAGEKVLVVTHGGTLRCFRAILERWDYDRATKWRPGESPKNCGITVYDSDPKQNDRLILQEHNTVY